MTEILLTGATGFVGGHLFRTLREKNKVKSLGRSKPVGCPEEFFFRGEIKQGEIYRSALEGTDVVIHAAAMTNIVNAGESGLLDDYRAVNTYSTLELAEQAAQVGVKRFIFLSSIKVNGEVTKLGEPFSVSDKPAPIEPYAISKYEAEIGLRLIAERTEMEVVIIRPPLIYGRGVKANFLSLIKITRKFLPLPLASLKKNRRSMVSIFNLTDFISLCIRHPKAANKIFLVSDNDDVSTTKLLQVLRNSQHGKSVIFPFPIFLLNFVARLTGTKNLMSRLTESLQIDIEYSKKELDWNPPFTFLQSVEKMFKVEE